jgi:hypothetical protein
MRVIETNNWEVLTHTFGNDILASGVDGVVIPEYTRDELKYTWVNKPIKVHDHGHSYTVLQWKPVVLIPYNHVRIQVPLTEIGDILELKQYVY